MLLHKQCTHVQYVKVENLHKLHQFVQHIDISRQGFTPLITDYQRITPLQRKIATI